MTMDFQNRALLNVDMPSWYYDGVTAKTRNLGTLGGAVQLGDGTTVGTFPTQVFPHGMSFDGGDYLLVDNSSGAYNFNGGTPDLPFSLEVLVRPSATVAGELMTKGPPYAAPGGWIFETFTAGGLTSPLMLFTDAAGAYFYGYASGTMPLAPVVRHVVMSYTGGGTIASISMYVDSVARAVVGAAGGGVYTGLSAGVLPVYVGGAALLSNRWYGSIFNAAIYPFALQPGEVAQLYRQRLAMLNRGAG